MESAIDILPQEVLHNIFSKLSVSDRLNASVVCKKWLEVLNCRSLLKDITVLINDNNNVPVFTFMSRNFLNFSFKLIIVDNKYYGLFKRFSSYVEYLSFENCEVWRREPIDFGDLKYDKLKVLRIIDCELWTLFPCLPNLTELYLTGRSTICDEGFAVLQKTMKCLKVLSLLCFVSYEQKVIKRFYPHNKTYETNPSPLILSFPAVYSFVSERASTLKEIHLGPEITSSALKELSSIKDLCFYKIVLANGFFCADGLIHLFKNQPSLKVLNLKNINNMNDTIINDLCSFLPDVEEIMLQNFTFTKISLKKLFQLTKLNKLDIGGGTAISASIFNAAILNFKAYQLKSLNLSHKIDNANRTRLDVLFMQCKHLVYLDLSHNAISDTTVHIISKYLVNLEYLILKHCKITDYALTGQKKDLLCEGTDEKNHCSLSNLKNLRELNLNDCDKITDNAVIDAIKFEYLEFLHVSGCKLKLDTLQKLLQQNRSIKKIIWDDDNIEHPKIEKSNNSRFDDFVEDIFVRDHDFIYPDTEDFTGNF